MIDCLSSIPLEGRGHPGLSLFFETGFLKPALSAGFSESNLRESFSGTLEFSRLTGSAGTSFLKRVSLKKFPKNARIHLGFS